MYFISRNRTGSSGLVAELEASVLDAPFFESLELEHMRLYSAERIAVVLRRLFDPEKVLELTPQQCANFRVPIMQETRYFAPVATYEHESVLLPDSVVKICRWLFEKQNARVLSPGELLDYNGEVFDGTMGAHADGSQKAPYGPTINTVYKGTRRVRMAVDGNLCAVPDHDFVYWWAEVEKVELTLDAGDMLLFFGFHDVLAKREGNPHDFSAGGLSVCCDMLKPAKFIANGKAKALGQATDIGYDLFATHRERVPNV